jgi:hypothetical protein
VSEDWWESVRRAAEQSRQRPEWERAGVEVDQENFQGPTGAQVVPIEQARLLRDLRRSADLLGGWRGLQLLGALGLGLERPLLFEQVKRLGGRVVPL